MAEPWGTAGDVAVSTRHVGGEVGCRTRVPTAAPPEPRAGAHCSCQVRGGADKEQKKHSKHLAEGETCKKLPKVRARPAWRSRAGAGGTKGNLSGGRDGTFPSRPLPVAVAEQGGLLALEGDPRDPRGSPRALFAHRGPARPAGGTGRARSAWVGGGRASGCVCGEGYRN